MTTSERPALSLMSPSSKHKLHRTVADLIPGSRLVWQDLIGLEPLRGFFLEEESALCPLPPDKVEAVMEQPPFWSLLWPSGEMLCRWLLGDPTLVSGRSVLDFGCGCGLVACAAAHSGASPAYAVDCDPLALAAAEIHAHENEVRLETFSVWDHRRVDLLLVADFLYDETHLPLFHSLQAQAEEVLVVDSRLRTLNLPGFIELGETTGKAIPDLDPWGEFANLRLWYRGSRLEEWRRSYQLFTPVARGVQQC